MKRTTFVFINAILIIISSLCLYYASVTIFSLLANYLRHFQLILPGIMTMVIPVLISIFFNICYYQKNKEKQDRLLSVFSWVLIAVTSFVIMFIVINVFVFLNGKFIIGNLTKLYPLDMLIINSLLLSFALLLLLFHKKFPRFNKDEKKICFSKKAITLLIVYCLFSLYFFGSFLVGLFCIDYTLPNYFLMFPIYLMLLIPIMGFVLYYFIYLNLDITKKDKFQLRAGLGLGIYTLASLLIYIICSIINPFFVIESGQVFFPLDFVISVKVGIIMLLLFGFCSSFLSLISLKRKSIHK